MSGFLDDPSVQRALRNNDYHDNATLRDVKFEDAELSDGDGDSFISKYEQHGKSTSSPHQGVPEYIVDFSQSQSSQTAPSNVNAQWTDMNARIQDLQQRERDLEAREAALDQRQDFIRRHGRNNWPLHSYPLLYHDIDEEIPPKHRPIMHHLYRVWLLLVTVLAFNCVSGILLFISGLGISDLILAIIYLPIISVLSFLCWYRPVYNGYMKEHAIFFYIFLIFGACHAVYTIYMLIGIPGCGSAGFITMIKAFSNARLVAAIFCAISTAGWLLETLLFIWLYGIVWHYTKGDRGYTWDQAKTEAGMHGIRAYFFRGKSVF